jgi:hypothetical protein
VAQNPLLKVQKRGARNKVHHGKKNLIMGSEKQGYGRYPCTSEESFLLIHLSCEKNQESRKGMKCGVQPNVGKTTKLFSQCLKHDKK